MTKGLWLTEEREHACLVRPVDDLITHSDHHLCTCAPTVTRIGYNCYGHHAPHLAVRLLITHHAMDGRE